MKTEIIHEGINGNGQRFKVIAFYSNSGFVYTKTYIYDNEGFVEESVTVFASGLVVEHGKEKQHGHYR